MVKITVDLSKEEIVALRPSMERIMGVKQWADFVGEPSMQLGVKAGEKLFKALYPEG